MRLRLALLFSLICSAAFAQVTPGTSPLSIAKGGTNAATAAAARTSLGVTATGADTTYNFRANNLSDVANASTARSNLGLAIGSNVQAWDTDLNCLAAISTTGVIHRTGSGTCSAGAVALSDLATGTQDTVIGYFGSTAASAAAMPNCAGSLTYSTSTHLFGCNTGAGVGTVTGGAYPLTGATTMTYVGPTTSGQLQFVSSTSLTFAPFNGDIIRIAGVVYQIPSSGVSCGAPTSVFLNGTAAQTLAVNTTYYVYLFNNSGTLACDFSTTAYAVDSTAGNVGTFIKSGVASRSLIGMIRTGATVIYVSSATQAFVRTWFNDYGVALTGTAPSGSNGTATLVEVDSTARVNFLLWAGETADFSVVGTYTDAAADSMGAAVGFNGNTTTSKEVGCNIPSAGWRCSVNSRGAFSTLTEGFNFATPLIRTIGSAGAATFASGAGANVTGTVRR